MGSKTALLGSLMVMSFACSKPVEQKAPVDAGPPPKAMTAWDRVRAATPEGTWLVQYMLPKYEDNRVAADAKYKGKVIEVRGLFQPPEQFEGRTFVRIIRDFRNSNYTDHRGVRCFVNLEDPAQKAMVSEISSSIIDEKNKARVRGIVGDFDGTDVPLEGCVLLDPKEKIDAGPGKELAPPYSLTEAAADPATARLAKQVRLKSAPAVVNGRLPPQVITTAVEKVFDKVGLCYAAGLAKAPKLGGRLVMKFEIDESGAVTSAEDGYSDFADPRVVSCAVGEVKKLTFPKPESGTVKVSYPVVLSPG